MLQRKHQIHGSSVERRLRLCTWKKRISLKMIRRTARMRIH